jgi:hypothetical protein
MNKLTIHDRKQGSRKYSGEVEAAPLLDWLNSRGGHLRQQAKAEIERAMVLILSVYKAENAQRDQKELNEWLLQYTFTNRLDSGKSGLIWSLSVNADLARDYVRGESESVARIVELAKLGVLERIRKCDCGMYFFARFSRQRFHANECTVRFWEASPARKEQKRKKAKEYYYLHKNKNTK